MRNLVAFDEVVVACKDDPGVRRTRNEVADDTMTDPTNEDAGTIAPPQPGKADDNAVGDEVPARDQQCAVAATQPHGLLSGILEAAVAHTAVGCPQECDAITTCLPNHAIDELNVPAIADRNRAAPRPLEYQPFEAHVPCPIDGNEVARNRGFQPTSALSLYDENTPPVAASNPFSRLVEFTSCVKHPEAHSLVGETG